MQALHVLLCLHGFSQRSPPSAYSPKNMHLRQIGLCGEARVLTNSRLQKKKAVCLRPNGKCPHGSKANKSKTGDRQRCEKGYKEKERR